MRACLASLRDRANEARFETIVIENNSEDGSGDMVAQEFPEVRLFRQGVNLGFCGGHNVGVGHMLGKHWFCLNSDTIVHEGALRRMIDCLEANSEIAILGPKLLNTDGSLQYSVRRFPNPVAALFRNTLLGRLWPSNPFTRTYLMKDFDHDAPIDADWVSGAAFMMSRRALDSVGTFDPEYYMFCEDVDLCFRCHRAGFRVHYLPTAHVTHHIGRSTDKAPNRMIVRFHKSMYLFFKRNQIRDFAPLARPLMLFVAASGLTLRASAFIIKNLIDRLGRRLRR